MRPVHPHAPCTEHLNAPGRSPCVRAQQKEEADGSLKHAFRALFHDCSCSLENKIPLFKKKSQSGGRPNRALEVPCHGDPFSMIGFPAAVVRDSCSCTKISFQKRETEGSPFPSRCPPDVAAPRTVSARERGGPRRPDALTRGPDPRDPTATGGPAWPRRAAHVIPSLASLAAARVPAAGQARRGGLGSHPPGRATATGSISGRRLGIGRGRRRRGITLASARPAGVGPGQTGHRHVAGVNV